MAAKISGNLEKILEILPKSRVEGKDIVKEAEQSFLDYSLSVITSRALPDLRDGLKPVHRRILYSAYEEKMFNDSRYKKSAALVGAVMGSYHPHGDSSIYGALVRLCQDFSMRYPLLEGQGNFGSIDGDGPAAMRYTEVKMSKMGEMFLDGIKEECIDFVSNYDGSKEEPKVLPVVVPSILLNGGEGIAVGMASKIPPHNLHEVCDAAIALIENSNLTFEELNKYIKGPDFPTGGTVIKSGKKKNNIENYLKTGEGTFIIRAQADINKEEKQIIVTSIPFGVKKSQLIKSIAERASEEKGSKKKSKGKVIDLLQRFIRNIRDESNLKEGIRLVIECEKKNTREEDLQVVLNNLYKYTPLQKPYSPNLTLLNEGRPEVWGVLEILRQYLKHQLNMLVKRTQYNLNKLEERIHLLEGRKIVVEDLIQVIKIITENESPEETMKQKYSLSDKQIKDVFDLPLRQLKKIEFKKLVDELEEKYKRRAENKALLASEALQKEKIKRRLQEVKEAFKNDKRLTEIYQDRASYFRPEDLILKETLITSISEKQYISAFPLDASKEFNTSISQGDELGTLPVKGDEIQDLLIASSKDDLLLFSDNGIVYKLKTHQIKVKSDKGWSKKPILIKNLISISGKGDPKIVEALTMREQDYGNNLDNDRFLFLVTERGKVKKLRASLFRGVKKNGKKVMRLQPGDKLKFVIKIKSDSDIFMSTREGQSIRCRTEVNEDWAREIESLPLFKTKNPIEFNKLFRELFLLNNYEMINSIEDSEAHQVINMCKLRAHFQELQEFRKHLNNKIKDLKSKLKSTKNRDESEKIESNIKELESSKILQEFPAHLKQLKLNDIEKLSDYWAEITIQELEDVEELLNKLNGKKLQDTKDIGIENQQLIKLSEKELIASKNVSIELQKKYLKEIDSSIQVLKKIQAIKELQSYSQSELKAFRDKLKSQHKETRNLVREEKILEGIQVKLLEKKIQSQFLKKANLGKLVSKYEELRKS